jgi:hypothetical protein
MSQVFVLNMTYDIGLKQISFHLIVLSLFLLAPEFRRLRDFFFFPDRNVGQGLEPPLFKNAEWNRAAVILQVAFGVYLIGVQAYANWTYWYAAGDGSPRSPLYGIWKVDELSIDGEARPPFLADYDRQWRRVIFDTPDKMAFQRLDDSFARRWRFNGSTIRSRGTTPPSTFTAVRSRSRNRKASGRRISAINGRQQTV